MADDAGRLNQVFAETSFLYGSNAAYVEELQEKWGYPEITEDMRAKFLGLNLAKLAKIEPTKRVKKKG